MGPWDWMAKWIIGFGEVYKEHLTVPKISGHESPAELGTLPQHIANRLCPLVSRATKLLYYCLLVFCLFIFLFVNILCLQN